jgi:hypothetical protein
MTTYLIKITDGPDLPGDWWLGDKEWRSTPALARRIPADDADRIISQVTRYMNPEYQERVTKTVAPVVEERVTKTVAPVVERTPATRSRNRRAKLLAPQLGSGFIGLDTPQPF